MNTMLNFWRFVLSRHLSLLVAVALSAVVGGCGKGTAPDDDAQAAIDTAAVGKKSPVVVGEPTAFPRALWLWETEIFTSAESRPVFLSYCGEEAIRAVFVSLRSFPDNQYNRPYLEALERAVVDAHAAGLKVYALRAMPVSPKLAYTKAHYVAVTYLRDFLKYNAGLDKERQFDGVLLDIQSHTLPGWAENRGDIQNAYVAFVQEMRKTVIEFHYETSLGWALPTAYMEYAWFPQICAWLDFVVLTDVGVEAPVIKASARQFLSLTRPVDTRFYIDLDTREPESDEATSFFDTGRLAMERVVRDVAREFGDESLLAGVSIQDHENLSVLEP